MTKTLAVISYQSPNNTYIKEFISNMKRYYIVYWGTDFFWDECFFADYYVIHWPENIKVADNRFAFSLKDLSNRIQLLQNRGAKVSAFFHDANPHFKQSNFYNLLWKIIYTKTDVVFHLGQYSVNLLYKKYPESQLVKNVVIKHPLFESIPNFISREEARSKFGFNDNDFVLSFLGTFRSHKEIMLMYKIFKKLKINNKRLLIGGGDVYDYTNRLTMLISRIKKWYYTGKKLTTSFGKYVDDCEVQYYYKAADIILIPRIQNLNSGVALMAMTFNIPFIAPAIGNITELAIETGNFVFPPNDINVATNIIEKFANNRKTKMNISVDYSGSSVAKQIYETFEN